MECDNRFYLYTGHRFFCTISSTSVTIKKSPLSNFRIVSEQGRIKDLKTQNWQLYKSPERASAVSTNIWGDQPSRRSGLGFIVFGSEAWVHATSLCVWKSISCLLSLIQRSASVSPAPPRFSTLGLFGLIVHGTAHLPIYTGWRIQKLFSCLVEMQKSWNMSWNAWLTRHYRHLDFLNVDRVVATTWSQSLIGSVAALSVFSWCLLLHSCLCSWKVAFFTISSLVCNF